MYQRFSIRVTPSSGNRVLNALWDDKLKIIKEKEAGEQFYRKKIEGSLSFVNSDFDLIESSSLDTFFTVEVIDAKYENTGGSVQEASIAGGKFLKTDVQFDYDNKIATVSKISIEDNYTSILDHIDDEIDVLSLGLQARSLDLSKRAILQLYILGDNKVTHVVGNQSYEVDASSDAETYDEYQVIDKKFAKVDTYIEMNVEIFSDGAAASDVYLNGLYSGRYGNKIWRSDNQYYLADEGFWGDGSYAIYDSSSNRVRPSVANSDFRFEVVGALPYYENGNIYLEGVGTSEVVGLSGTQGYTLFARILQDRDTGFREADYPFTSFEVNNYRWVQPAPSPVVSLLGGNNYIRSLEVSSTPTRWGVNKDGEYFKRPEQVLYPVIPVGWSRWSTFSFWVQLTDSLNRYISVYDTVWTLRDAYSLAGVLSVLFRHFNIPISVSPTASGSTFFDGSETAVQNVLPGHVRQHLYITPITNVEKTFYDQAARKMKLSIGDIFKMLKSCFNVYWDVVERSDRTELRLEHLSFYDRGGTYGTVTRIMANVRTLRQPLLGKPWAFGQGIITYDVSDLPSRYEFGWPSECTDVFDGCPIQINNTYVESNSKEEITVPKFFADVDLVMSMPDSFPDDSIAILGTTDRVKVSRQTLTSLIGFPGMPSYHTQNGYLSFTFLEMAYHRYGISGDQAVVEDFPGSDTGEKSSIAVQKVAKFKQQTIRFPFETRILDEIGLIKTDQGESIPKKITYELDSCMVEAELLL